MCQVQRLLSECVMYVQYVRSVTCNVYFYICLFETFLMFLLYFLNILSFFLEIHHWVTESPYILYHLTFTFVDYVYIPICLAYMNWVDTITCSQSWDNDWSDGQCSWRSITRIFCLCIVLEVLLWWSFVVLKLFTLCILNHCFLVHAKVKLGSTPWWWQNYA